MSKIILILGAIVIVVLAAFLLFPQSQEQLPEEEIGQAEPLASARTIVHSADGYLPSELIIQQGDIVTFRNEDSRETWPASAIHPTHAVYPDSGIQKCFDEDEANDAVIFDACSGLRQGEVYSFTFHEAGTWRFHDHLRPSVTGTIIVE